MKTAEAKVGEDNIELFKYFGSLQRRKIVIGYMQSLFLFFSELWLVMLSIVINNSRIKVICLTS